MKGFLRDLMVGFVDWEVCRICIIRNFCILIFVGVYIIVSLVFDIGFNKGILMWLVFVKFELGD